MLTQGNVKLGERIYVWSLPVLKTCPGASAVCKEVCYAMRGQLRMINQRGHYEKQWRQSRRQEFVSWMTGEISRRCIDVMRVHVSGDFDVVGYVRKWRLIAQRARQTQFFAYTRSWNVGRLKKDLYRLGREPNFMLWLSADASMPRPPRWKGFGTCYLMRDDDDQPPYRTDLVFRDRVPTIMKRTDNGSLVCPYDNGITTTTCSQCKYCWRTHDRRGNVAERSTRASAAVGGGPD